MLDLPDARRRVAQFVAAGLPILVTTACLLVDKARLLSKSSFVVSAITQYVLGDDSVLVGGNMWQGMAICCSELCWQQ